MDRAVLTELGRLAGGIGPALSPSGRHDLLRSIAATAQRMFGASACSLALLDATGEELVFTTVVGQGAEVVEGMRMPSGHGIAGWVVMSGQPLEVTDLRNDPRWAADIATGTGYEPTSILAAPVATSQSVLGVLEILDRESDRPGSTQDMSLLSLVADQAALALEGARAFDDFGRQLLRAAAAAVDGDLAAALADAAEAAGPPDDDLLELASLFGELGRLDASARQLAVRVLSEFVRHAAAQRGRRSPRRPA